MRSSTLSSHAHNALLGVVAARNGRCASTVSADGVVVLDIDGEVRRARMIARDARESITNIMSIYLVAPSSRARTR